MKECSFEGCRRDTSSGANGLCGSHRRQQRLGQELRPIAVRMPHDGSTCALKGCDRPVHGRGYCASHAQQDRKGQVVRDLRKPGRSWYHDESGYLCRGESVGSGANRKQRKVFQHREVMENHLGRKLIKTENIHHINGVRDDNRIENLEIWSTSQPPGQRLADKLKWAKDLLDFYQPNFQNDQEQCK